MKHLTSRRTFASVPPECRPIINKALAKDPSQRFGSMAEMTAAIESLDKPHAAVPARVSDTLPYPPPITPMPSGSLPTLTYNPHRRMIGELAWSMCFAAVISLMTTTFLAAVTQANDWNWVRTAYFLTVATCWVVLIPTKFWTEQKKIGDAWARRLTLMACGAGVGVLALWLEGWDLRRGITPGRDAVDLRRDAIAAGAATSASSPCRSAWCAGGD